MIKIIEIALAPKDAFDQNRVRDAAARELGVDRLAINAAVVAQRTIDSRRKLRTGPIYRLKVHVYMDEWPTPIPPVLKIKPTGAIAHAPTHVPKKRKAIIIGCGPAGMFAAHSLLESGIEPLILEQGKDVLARRDDLRAIMEHGLVSARSNFCFGEGGAGTYSDGKLYTRSKRGNTRRILDILLAHGAPEEILVDSHPHLGSNRLPEIVSALRNTLLENGAQIRYNSRATDLCVKDGKIRGVVVNDTEELLADAVLLAVGHSARDMYETLRRRQITLEPKPFALGFRIEHSQAVIDRAQYHLSENAEPNQNAKESRGAPQRGNYLPPARYHLSQQVEGRALYTFCMCPGGAVIPASTGPNELVLNGMSFFERNSAFSNAGLVVSVGPEDWQAYNAHGAFAGLELQRQLEQAAFTAGGGGLCAPAQRATDFVTRKISQTLPASSYRRGTKPVLLNDLLPPNLATCLQIGLPLLGNKIHGFFSEDALLLGVESRTSSPIRIPRDKKTLMHVDVRGLFPAGEGAGYAGGIVSSAVDGIRCAEALVGYLNPATHNRSDSDA